MERDDQSATRRIEASDIVALLRLEALISAINRDLRANDSVEYGQEAIESLRAAADECMAATEVEWQRRTTAIGVHRGLAFTSSEPHTRLREIVATTRILAEMLEGRRTLQRRREEAQKLAVDVAQAIGAARWDDRLAKNAAMAANTERMLKLRHGDGGPDAA